MLLNGIMSETILFDTDMSCTQINGSIKVKSIRYRNVKRPRSLGPPFKNLFRTAEVEEDDVLALRDRQEVHVW